MSYTEPLDDDFNDDPNTVSLRRDQIRALERDAKLAREAQARAEAAERNLAMVQAGIDLNNPAGAFFAANYKGDFAPDAVKAAWGEITGALTPSKTDDTPPPKTEDTPPTSPLATDLRQAIANGGLSDTGMAGIEPPKSTKQVALELGNDLLKKGAPEDEAMGAVFAKLCEGAITGDQSVVRPGFNSPR